MIRVEVADRRGERQLGESDFPLSLGGERASVALPGLEAEITVAWLGLADGDVFVQAEEGGGGVFLNGRPLSASEWLRDGDVLRFGGSRVRVRRDGERLLLRVEGATEDQRPGAKLVPPREPRPESRPLIVEPIEFRPRSARAASAPRFRFGGIGRWLWAAALVLLVAAGGWLLSARSISLAVEPDPEALRIEGGPALPLAGRWVVRPGHYEVTAEAAGYRPLRAPIEVTRDGPDDFAFELEPLPGRVTVDVGGLAGAVVRVDGAEAGETPIEPLELAAGVHRIEVEAEGHFSWHTDLEVEGYGAEQTVRVELRSRVGTLRVSSRPAGAQVRVDGRELGSTPLEAPLLAGSHVVELRRPGFAPVRRGVEIRAEETTTLAELVLEPAPASLALSSTPSDAAVRVDGDYRGQTPLDVVLEPGRSHRIELSLPGYRKSEHDMALERGETRDLAVALDPETGFLEVSVRPAGAEIVLGGEVVGQDRVRLELPATGAHEVEARLPGYRSERATVTPTPGFPQRLDFALLSVEEARAAAIEPVIRTSQGQELLLVEGGSFTMGASRREPGRRANEGLRDVELRRPFYLATEEVSNAEFAGFRAGHRSGVVGSASLEVDDHPVVNVSWEEAARYCNWLSEREGLEPVYEERNGTLVARSPIPDGYRLPTEAEWAWVARFGGRAGEPRKYAWGDSLPVTAGAGNFADRGAGRLVAETLDGYDDGHAATAPVDAFGPDDRGFYNLGGNVAEWMHDRYTVNPAAVGVPAVDPSGPTEGELHVIRGASWRHATVTELRLTFRDYGREPRPDVGFRLARYLGDPTSEEETTP